MNVIPLWQLPYPIFLLVAVLSHGFAWRQLSRQDSDVLLASLWGLASYTFGSSLVLYLLALCGEVRSQAFLAAPLLVALPPAALGFRDPGGFRRFAKELLIEFADGRYFLLPGLLLTLFLSLVWVHVPPHLYDSWSYHLPVAALALAQGKIPLHFPQHPFIEASPPLLELYRTWLWQVAGGDSLLEGAQLPFAYGLGALTYWSGRKYFRCSRIMTSMAAWLVFLSPKVIENGTSSNLDVQAAYGLGLGIVLFSRRWYLEAALVGAACAGARYSALPPGGALLAAGLWGTWIERRRNAGILVVVSAIFLSWYGVNGIRLGNPTFPFSLNEAFPNLFRTAPCSWSWGCTQALSLRALSGGLQIRTPWAWGAEQWLTWLDARCPPYGEYLSRWGIGMAALGAPAIVLQLALLFFRALKRASILSRSRSRFVLASVASIFVLPMVNEARFSLFLLPAAMGAASYWLSQLLRTFRGLRLEAVARLALALVLVWAGWGALARQGRLFALFSSAAASPVSRGLSVSLPPSQSGPLREISEGIGRECIGSELWVDFGIYEHEFGSAVTAAYALFRPDWRLATISRKLEEADLQQIASGAGSCLVIFRGAAMANAKKPPPLRQLVSNELATLWKVTKP